MPVFLMNQHYAIVTDYYTISNTNKRKVRASEKLNNDNADIFCKKRDLICDGTPLCNLLSFRPLRPPRSPLSQQCTTAVR